MNSTFTMGGAIIFRARKEMAAAPAVWELEGPIILGPSTSKTLIKAISAPSLGHWACAAWAGALLMNF